MSELLGAAFAHVLPWLAGLLTLIAGAWGIHAAGKREARHDAAQRAADDAAKRKEAIHEAIDTANHDPDWRRLLKERK